MITFVCGKICSGKTVYAQTLAWDTDAVFVEIGNLVREIKKTEDREKLQDSKDLSKAISDQLLDIEQEHMPRTIVACGPRQVEIVKRFPHASFIWIEVPAHERKARYLSRARAGDTIIPFEEAEKGDEDLGILEVKKYILERNT